jgi:hypothetical protein
LTLPINNGKPIDSNDLTLLLRIVSVIANSSRRFIAFLLINTSPPEIKTMNKVTFSLRVLSGTLLITGTLLISVASHASYSDYIPYRLINQGPDASHPGWRVCTYESQLNRQRINLSLQYTCWPAAFQSRVDGQFYDRIS